MATAIRKGFPVAAEVEAANLSPEEEMRLIREYQDGNEAALNTLVKHNLRFAYYIAAKYRQTFIEFEDVCSIAFVGLVKAIQRFDCTRAQKLTTLAGICIENEIRMALRPYYRTQGVRHASMNLEDIPGYQDMFKQTCIPDPAHNAEMNDCLRHMWEAMKHLPDPLREVIYRRYFCGINQREVAHQLGYSQSYVSRLEKKALAKLRLLVLPEEAY